MATNREGGSLLFIISNQRGNKRNTPDSLPLLANLNSGLIDESHKTMLNIPFCPPDIYLSGRLGHLPFFREFQVSLHWILLIAPSTVIRKFQVLIFPVSFQISEIASSTRDCLIKLSQKRWTAPSRNSVSHFSELFLGLGVTHPKQGAGERGWHMSVTPSCPPTSISVQRNSSLLVIYLVAQNKKSWVKVSLDPRGSWWKTILYIWELREKRSRMANFLFWVMDIGS